MSDGDEEFTYKTNSESVYGRKEHVYDCGETNENTFTKAELLSIHLSKLTTKFQIPRAAYRDIVRFVNTCLRDYEEIKSG